MAILEIIKVPLSACNTSDELGISCFERRSKRTAPYKDTLLGADFYQGGPTNGSSIATPDQLVELLSSSTEQVFLGVCTTGEKRFATFPIETQREALIRGLSHEVPRIRLACAERLGHWRNSPRITMAMLDALTDSERRVRSHAAIYLAYLGCCQNPDEAKFILMKLCTIINSESDADIIELLKKAITRFGA